MSQRCPEWVNTRQPASQPAELFFTFQSNCKKKKKKKRNETKRNTTMANHKPKTTRPASPVKKPPQSEQPTQGISGRLFGLLKKFPMQIASPSKELPPQADSQSEEDQSDSQEEEEEEEDEEGDEEIEEEHVTESEEEEEEEEEDPLGDEQCKAIIENYMLESQSNPH
jgi:hypothetical protein